MGIEIIARAVREVDRLREIPRHARESVADPPLPHPSPEDAPEADAELVWLDFELVLRIRTSTFNKRAHIDVLKGVMPVLLEVEVDIRMRGN